MLNVFGIIITRQIRSINNNYLYTVSVNQNEMSLNMEGFFLLVSSIEDYIRVYFNNIW